MASLLDQFLASSLEPKSIFFGVWQVIPNWLVVDATGCEQSELLLLCCGSTRMTPAASLWNKSLATGCSMMVYPWVDTCCLLGFNTMQRNCIWTLWLHKRDTSWKIKTTRKNTVTAATRKSPGQICVSPAEKIAKTTQTGPSHTKKLQKFMGNMQAGLESFNQQPCFAESCHSVTLAKCCNTGDIAY